MTVVTTPAHRSEWLTVADVAAELACSEPTVRRRIRAGEIPAVRLGRARFRGADSARRPRGLVVVPSRQRRTEDAASGEEEKRDRYGQHIYGSMHKAARKRWAPKVRAGVVSCWRCGKPIAATERWDLGHVDEDGQARGFPKRHPEHRSCNRATVTILKQKLTEAEAPSSTSREW